MKKKFFVIFLAIIASVCLALGLSACGGDDDSPNGDSHTHTFSTDWSYDQTYHWRSCAKEDCDAISEKTEHTYDGDVCSVCGYQPYMDVAGKIFELSSIDVRWAPFNVSEDKKAEFEAQKQALKADFGADSDDELFTMIEEYVRSAFEDEEKCKIIFSDNLPVVSFVGMGDPDDLGGTYYQKGNYIYFSNSRVFGGVFAETLYLEGNTITMRLVGVHSPSSLIEIVLSFENNADDSLMITTETPSADSVAEKTYKYNDYEIEYEIPKGLSQDEKNDLIESINWVEESIKGSEMYISFDDSMNFSFYSSGEYEIYSDNGLYYQDNSLLYIPYHEGSYDNICVSICQISGTELSFNLALSRGQFSIPASIRLIFEQISTEHVLFYFEASESTCEYEGNIEYWYCPSCGKYFSDADGKNEIAYDDVILPKLEHKLQAVVAKAPTCTETGWDEYEKCLVCGTIINYNELSPLGHDKINHDGKAATCTEAGWEEYVTCSRCDYTTYKEVPALNHDLIKHDGKAATCTEAGWEEYVTCSRCDYTTYKEIPAMNHDLIKHDGKAATCTEAGWEEYVTCSRCDYTTFKEIEKFGHSFSTEWAYNNTYHWHKCTRCNEVKDKAQHAYDASWICEECQNRLEETLGLEFRLEDSGDAYKVCGIGSVEDINILIPSFYNGLPVKTIADSAFNNCNFIENIVISDGILSLEDFAFAGCKALKKVELPDSINIFGRAVFSGCINLESINIPSGIAEIPSSSFDSCTALREITIPGNVKYIDFFAFGNCSTLEEVIFCEGVEHIGDMAFSRCTALSKVELPKGLLTIDSSFNWCTSIVSIEIPDSVIEIGGGAFEYCTSLQMITIGKGVKYIGRSAFRNCTSLQNLVIPENVENIEIGALGGCTALESLSLPFTGASRAEETDGHLSYIFGQSHSDFPSSLKEVTISQKNIRRYSFQSAPIKSVILTESVESIEEYAFSHSDITSIQMSSSLIEIGDYAFSYCENLSEVNIPDTVSKFGYSVFQYCSSLKSVYLGTEINSIQAGTFYACESLAEIDISGDITSIDTSAFYGCESLKKISLPDSLLEIANSAFKNCISLSEINFPDSLVSIGRYAFDGCVSFKNLILGTQVTEIDSQAFLNCCNIEKIVVETGNKIYFSNGNCLISKDTGTLILGCKTSSIPNDNSVFNIGPYAFNGSNLLTSITIPESITQINSTAFLGCTSLETINVADTNAIYCSEDGVLFSKDKTVLVYYPAGKQTVSYAVPYGVSIIEDSAFDSSINLKSVFIPETVTYIGQKAFNGSASIEFEDGIGYADKWAVCYDDTCKGKLTLRSDTIGIAEGAFYLCGLQGITIPNSVHHIGNDAFLGCSSLEFAILGNGITYISKGMFDGCNNIKYLVLPKGISQIARAFTFIDEIDAIFYKGDPEAWNSIIIDSDNVVLETATVYYYSDELTEEQKADDYNYWHYDTDGETPVIWTKETSV